MDHVEYVYTSGMTESETDEFLREGDHGVLALADGNDAYAVPLNYHYDGEVLLLRVSEHNSESEKLRYLKTTNSALFLCYEVTSTGSWSIQIRGAIQRWQGEIDETTLNKWFPPFHVFDESVNNVEFSLYKLEMDEVTGRRTIE